jgi:hypothetical protein
MIRFLALDRGDAGCAMAGYCLAGTNTCRIPGVGNIPLEPILDSGVHRCWLHGEQQFSMEIQGLRAEFLPVRGVWP